MDRVIRALARLLVLALVTAAAGCARAGGAISVDGAAHVLYFEAGAVSDAGGGESREDAAPLLADSSGCTAGCACPSTNPCHRAAISCAGGVAVCTDIGLVPAGSSCGGGMVCSSTGACGSCSAGTSCTPAACHTGLVSCSTGTPVCQDSGTVPAGSSCGGGMVCSSSGSCIACSSGAGCTPSNPCDTGAIDCSSGSPVCSSTGTASAGASCPTGECDGGGRCGSFFGAWESNGATCGGSCQDGNPLDSGQCLCAIGGQEMTVAVDDCAGAGSNVTATLTFCEATSTASGLDFAGVYQEDDPVAGGIGCRVGNPYLSGSCGCPSGSSAIGLRVIVDLSGGPIGSEIYVCADPSAPIVTFGGAYEQDDPVAGGYGCRVGNPYASGTCTCPAGTSGAPYRVEADTSSGIIGSTIYLCTL